LDLVENGIEKDRSILGGENRYPKLNPKCETSEKFSRAKAFIFSFFFFFYSANFWRGAKINKK